MADISLSVKRVCNFHNADIFDKLQIFRLHEQSPSSDNASDWIPAVRSAWEKESQDQHMKLRTKDPAVRGKEV